MNFIMSDCFPSKRALDQLNFYLYDALNRKKTMFCTGIFKF